METRTFKLNCSNGHSVTITSYWVDNICNDWEVSGKWGDFDIEDKDAVSDLIIYACLEGNQKSGNKLSIGIDDEGDWSWQGHCGAKADITYTVESITYEGCDE